jgi:hypothetical protein
VRHVGTAIRSTKRRPSGAMTRNNGLVFQRRNAIRASPRP